MLLICEIHFFFATWLWKNKNTEGAQWNSCYKPLESQTEYNWSQVIHMLNILCTLMREETSGSILILTSIEMHAWIKFAWNKNGSVKLTIINNWMHVYCSLIWGSSFISEVSMTLGSISVATIALLYSPLLHKSEHTLTLFH